MKTSILALALLPTAFAAEGIKLWKARKQGYVVVEEERCYATVDNDDGCSNACNRENARHAFFDVSKWQEGANFARFTDPRAGTDKWLNIWPDKGREWNVFIEGGDGKVIGHCYPTNDKSCFCGKTANYANAFAYCTMYD